jgi:predicted anti-sigma-YlaC factor YlaD
MNKHLTTDELVDRLYGVGSGDHLHECEECSERFQQLRERREMAAEVAPASYEFLAAQRRNVYARMGEKPQARMKWVPALAAAACLLAAVSFVHRPETQAAKQDIVDPQLFADVYSMEQSMEPLAAKPMDALFDQDQQ